MEYFLEKIARSLYTEFGNTLNRHCLVFPNRRAGLYFLKYLSSEIKTPVWTPAIMTINELFRKFSGLSVAENEILLFELYKNYRQIKKTPESFDEFFFWGDMLLNDFDDIDKYLVNADVLFNNVRDLKKIDEIFGGFTDEQTEIIKRFWINFDENKSTREKEGFISIWEILSGLYNSFRNTLKERSLGYEGMIFRDVVENAESSVDAGKHWDFVHFIGFNALNECEKEIMLRLKGEGRARFYWDYDNYYIKPGKMNSAGFFMKENLRLFGNDMPADWNYDTFLTKKDQQVSRRVIDASSDVGQVKLLPSLLNDLGPIQPENACHTAVVLADENLLLPMLTSIPDNIGDVNITMGFPLKQTGVYSLVKDLMDLQNNSSERKGVVYFERKYADTILKNNTVINMLDASESELVSEIGYSNSLQVNSEVFYGSSHLKTIFSKPSTPLALSGYFREILTNIASANYLPSGDEDQSSERKLRNEFIYRIVLLLNRLEAISGSAEVSFSNDTWIRIFDRLLRMQSIPFTGEPLSGIQVMGILETRALDFENIIILSVNEGVLPAVSSGPSFIPYSLRQAFGLPSINHRESVYAYHFYRLLQRAKNITFIYNSNTDGLRSGEMSRFLLQMKYEPVLCPDFLDLNFSIKTASSVSQTLERTEEHTRLLLKRYVEDGKTLSPSAINTWLSCRMRFYYRYVNGLMEPDRSQADIDPAMFGNLLHEIMSECYKPVSGINITGDFFDKLISDNKRLTGLIDDAFRKKFNRPEDQPADGNELIVREVLLSYFLRVLKADKACSPFKISALEENFSFMPGIINGLKVGGKIDRIDLISGRTRIVDYKTGTVSDFIKSISSLFDEDRKKEPDGWLQILLYCEAFLSGNQGSLVYPVIYKIKKTDSDKLPGELIIRDDNMETVVDDYSTVRQQFLDGLNSVIIKIFGENEHFTMTSDTWGKCTYCPYHSLCLR